MIDNSEINVENNKSNCMKIKDFVGDVEDLELIKFS